MNLENLFLPVGRQGKLEFKNCAYDSHCGIQDLGATKHSVNRNGDPVMHEKPCPCLFGRNNECSLEDEELKRKTKEGSFAYREKSFEVFSIPFFGLILQQYSGFSRFERLRFKYFRKLTKRHNARHARWGNRGLFYDNESVLQEVKLYT